MQIGRFTGHTSKISGRFPSLLMDDGSLLETTTPLLPIGDPALQGHTKSASSVAVSPDGFQMIPASWDKTALPVRLCSLLSDSRPATSLLCDIHNLKEVYLSGKTRVRHTYSFNPSPKETMDLYQQS